MDCKSCGFGNPDNAKFCGNCGADQGRRCTSCDAAIVESFKFCGQCGTPVADNEAAFTHDGERRQLTLMFCDLVDSTIFSERLDPEDWREIVRGYQKTAADVIGKYAGHVAQYLGDGILVYFGYPRADEHDAIHAVSAGLDIITAVAAYNESITSQSSMLGDLSVQVRIGIHTGAVVTGEIGHGDNTDQLALGSAPNIAARVQGLATPGEMLLTASTQSLIAKQLECISIGQQPLKGVSQPTELFRVIGVRDPDVIETVDRRAPPFVGRDEELHEILRLQALSSRGEGQTVVLKGEAGIGKSRLQREVRRRLQGLIHQWYTCRCSELHENSALYPILELFARILGANTDSAALESWLVDMGLNSPEHHSVLSVLLNIEDGPPAMDIKVSDAQQRTIKIVTDVLRQLSNAGPIVFAFEDVHWADPSTLEVVRSLINSTSAYRILIVVSTRPGFVPGWEPASNQTLIELGRFSSVASEQMVKAWVADKLPPSAIAMLVERTDGVPLFLEELTWTLLDAEPDDREFGNLIPATLRDSLMARLDRLGPAKHTAQLGALLGRHFGFDLLMQVSHLPMSILEDHLSRIVDSGLLLRKGNGPKAGYTFKHALVQDTAYDSLLKRQRRQLHNQVVQAMQRDDNTARQMHPELLARHLEGAARIEEAVAQFQSAATRANTRWALVEAIGLYRHALNLLKSEPRTPARDQTEIELLRALAEPLRAYTSYTDNELVKIFDRTLELVRSMDEHRQFPVLVNMWGVHCVRGHRENAEAAAQELMHLALKSNNDTQLASAHFASGCTEVYAGHLNNGVEHLTNAITIVDSNSRFGSAHFDFDRSLFLARLVKAWALALQGQPDSSRNLLANVLATCEQHNASFPLAQTLCHMNVVDQDLETDPTVVLKRAHRILRVAQEHRMSTWVQFAHMHAGWARAMLGEDNGLLELRSAIDTFYVDDEITRGHTLLTLGQALQAFNLYTEAADVITEAEEFFDRNLSKFAAAEAPRLRGLHAAQHGDHDSARAAFQQSQGLAESQGNKLLQLKSLCDETALLQDSNEVQGLAPKLHDLFESITEGRKTPPLLRAAALVRAHRQ